MPTTFLSPVTRRLASYKRHPPQRRLLDNTNYQRLRPPWSWRRWFSLWSQMEFHEQTWLGKGSSVCPHDQNHRSGLTMCFKRPRYLVVNADEGEPGTCKDREILRGD